MQNIDLKSLQVFAMLLKERNVTRAAQRLNMTQSAVSHVLVRLRDLFHDPLFVSMGRGMAPTDRALELAEPLRQSLDALTRLTRPAESFDARRYDGSFRIATSDYIGFIVLPPLVQRLGDVAPDVALDIRPLHPHDDLLALKNGDIDLIIWNEASAPPNFYARRLFTDQLKSIVRKDHPRIQGGLTLPQFLAERHLRVGSHYGAIKEASEQATDEYAVRCKLSMSVPHFLLAHILVSQSNLVGMIAELTARRLSPEVPLQILEPPVPMPVFTVAQVWHERQHADPAHRWLRGEIAAVAEQIRQEQQAWGAGGPMPALVDG